jgi:hypothetical protein
MLVLPIECNGSMSDRSRCGSRSILPQGLKDGCTLLNAGHLLLDQLTSLSNTP